MIKNLKNTKNNIEKRGRIDSMFIGVMKMVKIVNQSVQLVSASVDTDSKIIILIILKQDK